MDNRKSDLHIHTTYSDGILSPSEVVEWGYKKQLTDMAITDHDTTEGIDEAIEAGLRFDINIVPGIELSCIERDQEVHMLGYFIDYKSDRLREFISILKRARENRCLNIIEKLNNLKIDITYEEVIAFSKEGSIGRPHIAKVLIEKGIVDTMDGAFKIYLGKGRPAYADRYKVSTVEAIDLIHSLGGVAVLAHPGLIVNESVLNYVMKQNIDGIESIHSKHTDSQVESFSKIARNLKLRETAGSDCHGHLKDGELQLGEFFTNSNSVDLLKEKSNIYKSML